MKNGTSIYTQDIKESQIPLSSQDPIQTETKKQGDVVVSVRHVSKKFCRNLKRSMAYGIVDLSKNLLGMKPDSGTLRQSEFWALNDVNFDLRQGQTLGVIGMNGSGKTTLLRALTGIFPPDKGEIIVKGRVGALVAVGAGFHPHMTGHENIYLNGTILGMTRKELESKFKSIVEFSEIEEFLDAPVSTYSSGMRVRLGFSIALHCMSDVLLIDEVLSVGDLSFRNKSLRRMHEYREKANALIFVSHSLEQVRALCNRVIVLNKGRIVFDGTTHEGCLAYEEFTREIRSKDLKQTFPRRNDQKFQKRFSSLEEFDLLDVGILDTHYQKAESIRMDDPLIMSWDVRVKKDLKGIYFNANVISETDVECIWVTSKDHENSFISVLPHGDYRIIIEIPQHHLVPNVYMPGIFIRSDKTGETYERIWANYTFRVQGDGSTLEKGIIAVNANWKLEKLK